MRGHIAKAAELARTRASPSDESPGTCILCLCSLHFLLVWDCLFIRAALLFSQSVTALPAEIEWIAGCCITGSPEDRANSHSGLTVTRTFLVMLFPRQATRRPAAH